METNEKRRRLPEEEPAAYPMANRQSPPQPTSIGELDRLRQAIVAKPKEEYAAEVLHTFWVAQCGAHVLAKNYPEAVSLNHLTV